jgi:hypothetical protein
MRLNLIVGASALVIYLMAGPASAQYSFGITGLDRPYPPYYDEPTRYYRYYTRPTFQRPPPRFDKRRPVIIEQEDEVVR